MFPTLSIELRQQLHKVEPSSEPITGVEYRPCRVGLRDGRVDDFVYVQEVASYLERWGVLPAEDSAKREIALGDIVSIEDSPRRLPVQLANRLYEAGETGMGYQIFSVVFPDGVEVPCLTGTAVDFVDLPVELDPRSAVDVRVGVPRSLREDEYYGSADYAWCLYENDDGPPRR